MSYLVTGATGFIGRYLVRELLARTDVRPIWILVRHTSAERFAQLRQWWNASETDVVAIEGDLTAPLCGVSAAQRTHLRGNVQHFMHLGALYDLEASDADLVAANVTGTRNAVSLAADLRARCFHLCSSIAAAGRYDGVFFEHMFAEASGLDHPYFRTKHESEAIVRNQSRVPWRIYRPGMVVGHSQTGHITKIDGPYYLFKTLQTLRRALPSWLPTVGIEGGYVNVVPVDFVTRALVHLAALPGLDGRCFHLTDPRPRRAGEVLNLFARAGHAPLMGLRIDTGLLQRMSAAMPATLDRYAPAQAVIDPLCEYLQLPRSVLKFMDLPTLFDNAATRALLDPADIRVPPLEDYAWRLWDYWERQLDPDVSLDRSLAGAVSGKRVLITGGSSGIGRAAALKLAQAGAHAILVARDAARLVETQTEIVAQGGKATVHACDITDTASCVRLVADVVAQFGGIDILINNAGRSIRRSLSISCDRLHDFERLMQVNYFGAVRLTLGFLPHLVRQHGGQVIMISSIGVLSNAPRFAGYAASKAAAEAFARCAASEYRDDNVHFTVINMPLVRTPMIAPTHMYDYVPVMTPQEAALLIAEAVIHKPPRIVSRLGMLAQALEMLAPRLLDVINNTYFHMYPDSAAARGDGAPEQPPTPQAIAFASLLKGLHW